MNMSLSKIAAMLVFGLGLVSSCIATDLRIVTITNMLVLEGQQTAITIKMTHYSSGAWSSFENYNDVTDVADSCTLAYGESRDFFVINSLDYRYIAFTSSGWQSLSYCGSIICANGDAFTITAT